MKEATNELMGKFLAGEASPDEAMQLDQILKDPASQLEYEKTLKLWKALPASPDTTLPEIKSGWQNLQKGLKPVTSIYKYLAVGTVTAVLVISSLFMIFRSEPAGNSHQEAATISNEILIGLVTATKPISSNNDKQIRGSFTFQDMSLTEAVKQIEKTFNVKIELDKAKFTDCHITAVFSNKPLSYILEIISITFNTNHTSRGKTIIINGKGCN